MAVDMDDGRTANPVIHPMGIAVLTISDSRTAANDLSGDTLAARITAAGHTVVERALAADEIAAIRARLETWIADPRIAVILTTGGTGLTARDVTPEAVRGLADKEIPGFGELFRWLSFANIGTSTIQSRALAVIAGRTYIFALPGSPGACRDAWDEILVHQLDSRHRPCNFVELLDRL
jgi:molybdenum cofactor biosynthesis protein B